MRRRQVIMLLSGAVALPLARPLALLAQPAMPVIGFLGAASAKGYAGSWQPF